MGNFLKTQNVFSSGEVSPEFYSTDNVHGVAKLAFLLNATITGTQ